MKTYATEVLDEILQYELSPLLFEHWCEIAMHKDINKLSPDWDRYYKLQDAGMLKIYTVRNDGKLVGYSIYLIATNSHYSESLQAANDVIFVQPEHRGLASCRLIQYAERELAAIGVEKVTMHMKVTSDHPRLFNFLGYEHTENVREKVIKRG